MNDLAWMRSEVARIEEEIRSTEDLLQAAEQVDDVSRVRDLQAELDGLRETLRTFEEDVERLEREQD